MCPYCGLQRGYRACRSCLRARPQSFGLAGAGVRAKPRYRKRSLHQQLVILPRLFRPGSHGGIQLNWLQEASSSHQPRILSSSRGRPGCSSGGSSTARPWAAMPEIPPSQAHESTVRFGSQVWRLDIGAAVTFGRSEICDIVIPRQGKDLLASRRAGRLTAVDGRAADQQRIRAEFPSHASHPGSRN